MHEVRTGPAPDGYQTPEEQLRWHLLESRKHQLQAVARRMNVPYSTLAAIAEGRRRLHAERLPPLYGATRDLDLFADASGARASGLIVLAPPQVDASGESLVRDTLTAEAMLGQVAGKVVAAISDGEVDEREVQEILRSVPDAERGLARVRVACEQHLGLRVPR